MIHRILAIALLAIAVFTGTGWYLSPRDELAKSDAIVAISGDSGDRLRAAIGLHRSGWAPLLIFSGAAMDPQSPSNALTMKWAAVGAGIDPSLVLIDETSRNTFENARHSAQIIHSQKVKRIILVTSAYHQRRAYKEFREALGPEVDIINYPTQGGEWSWSKWWLTPTGWILTTTELPKLVVSAIRINIL